MRFFIMEYNLNQVVQIQNQRTMKNLIGNIKKRLNGNKARNNNKEFDHKYLPAIMGVDINSTIIAENIRDFAYKEAGRHNGDPTALDNGLNMVLCGKIVDEKNNKSREREEQGKIDQEIHEIKRNANSVEAEIQNLMEVKIPAKENEIQQYKEEINDQEKLIREGRPDINWFNYRLYWIVFIPATIYLFFFYVSAFHSAFFRNIAAEVAKADINSIQLIINSVFNFSAFRELNMHWLAPVIFFVFATLLHIALEKKSAFLPFKVILLLLFVFVADALLAYFIERNNHLLSELTGMAEGEWIFYKSPVFLLVLFMGFFTCLGWSFILHQLAAENHKKNYERIALANIWAIKKKIYSLREQIKDLKGEVILKNSELHNLDNQIRNLEESKNNISYSIIDLEKNLTNFYNGWLAYINGIRFNSNLKEKCELIFRTFAEKNLNKAHTTT